MATECNEVFLGDQPCENGVNNYCFKDCLCPHHQGLYCAGHGISMKDIRYTCTILIGKPSGK
jgi:hypothetical protein